MSVPSLSHPVPPRRLSLVSQTVDCLERELQAGRLQGCLPGERDLAARLQVSRHTLRGALEILRRRGWIETTGRQRQRVTSPVPHAPESPASRVIGVISARPLDAMSQSSVVMVDHLRANLARAGLEMVIHTSPACFTAHPARALDSLVSRSPAAAWLLFGSLEPMQKWFVRHGLACLVVGSCAEGLGLPSVDVDYRAVCRHAGSLLRRRGHTTIALVRPAGEHGGDLESDRGLAESARGDASMLVRVLRHRGTATDVCAVIDEAIRSRRPPTAYIVARSPHVITVMMHLMLRGKRIPQDVAVLARDDDTVLQHAVPDVTRYSSSQTQFARRISAAVQKLAAGAALPRQSIRLMPGLVAGGTV